MKKLLGLLVLALMLVCGTVFSVDASKKTNVEKIMEMMNSGKVPLWNDVGNKVLKIYENTGNHNHFKTTYKEHYAIIDKGPNGNEMFTVILRDYQNYYQSHDARGFTLIILVDANTDGKVDRYRKEYLILLGKSTVLLPNYPRGLLNKDWFTMTPEEIQKTFDKELKYMLEHIDEAKKKNNRKGNI